MLYLLLYSSSVAILSCPMETISTCLQINNVMSLCLCWWKMFLVFKLRYIHALWHDWLAGEGGDFRTFTLAENRFPWNNTCFQIWTSYGLSFFIFTCENSFSILIVIRSTAFNLYTPYLLHNISIAYRLINFAKVWCWHNKYRAIT